MSHFLPNLFRYFRTKRRFHAPQIDTSESDPFFFRKEYARMEKISLPPPEVIETGLSGVLSKRASARIFAEAPLELAMLSTVLGHSLGLRNNSRFRTYPSGGRLYTIETYLLARNLEGVEAFVLHYDPHDHILEKLWPFEKDHEILLNDTRPERAAVYLIFTVVWERKASKYDDFAFPLTMIEVGHAAQNVLLTASALDLTARPYCGFDDSALIHMLDLDDSEEQPVYMIALGKR